MVFFKPEWIRNYRIVKVEDIADGVVVSTHFKVEFRRNYNGYDGYYAEWEKEGHFDNMERVIAFFEKVKAEYVAKQRNYVRYTRVSINEVLKAMEKA